MRLKIIQLKYTKGETKGFIQEDTGVADTYMEKWSTLLVIHKIKIKTTMILHNL
jgi:hypothetical protein